MPLIIPDESLCTVAEADDYHDKRGNMAAWTQMDADKKETLLRQAYDYLLAEFGSLWPVGMAFGAISDDVGIAPGARTACAILALIAKDGPLDPEITPQEIESEVGPIKSKYAARDNGGRRQFPQVVRLMSPYLVASTANPFSVQLVRA